MIKCDNRKAVLKYYDLVSSASAGQEDKTYEKNCPNNVMPVCPNSRQMTMPGIMRSILHYLHSCSLKDTV